MAKNTFVLSVKYGKQVKALTMEQRGILFTAIIAHESEEEIPEMDAATSMAFDFICADLDENREKYEKTCRKNAENAAKGAEAKKAIASDRKRSQAVASDGKRTQANRADNDNDIDNDNDLEKLSSNEDSKKTPAPKEKPMHFGDLGNVLLTETEHAKLIADKGQKAVDDAIAYLDAYIADKGYKHKSPTHYLAMRRWVFDAVNERKSPPGKIRPINKGYSERTYDMDAVEKELFAKMMAD